MGYRLGTSDELAERRKARLAARYGTPATAAVDPMTTDDVVAIATDGPGLVMVGEQSVQVIAPKKKGGRPKGSKNKGT